MIHKLEADSILLEFGPRKILSDIYLKCETGKITGLLGRNGQGKSSLMEIIHGNLNTVSKSVRIDNIPFPRAFKRPDLLVYLPQFNFIPPSLTLKRIFSDFKVEFGQFENHFPEFKQNYKSTIRSLSGGQRRLSEVYVITRTKSQFALLDEPFSHLMPLQIEKMQEVLLEEKNNKGFLITDHMFRQVTEISDTLYILKEGKTHLAKNESDLERLGYARF